VKAGVIKGFFFSNPSSLVVPKGEGYNVGIPFIPQQAVEGKKSLQG